MQNNPLDDIVKCDIEIANPGSDDATFDSILLVVSAPDAEGIAKLTKTTAISKADELLNYGYTVEDGAYLAASVAFSQSPSPGDVYVVVRKSTIPEAEEGDTETTEPTPVYEDIRDTLARANREASFYGIHITDFKDAEDVRNAVSWTETQEKIFGFEYTDINNCPIKNFSYYRSFGKFSGLADGYEGNDKPAENEYAALAIMAKCFGYQPGSETWNLKEEATIVPSRLTSDQKKTLEANNMNVNLRYASCNCNMGGKMLSGEWIDVIRFRDWLKNRMQFLVFGVLKANTKVPFEDSGIGAIQGAMEKALSEGQTHGGIAQTSFDADDNEIPGYVTSVPLASDLTEDQRKSRKLPNCRWRARLAGAIHLVEIDGTLRF